MRDIDIPINRIISRVKHLEIRARKTGVGRVTKRISQRVQGSRY